MNKTIRTFVTSLLTLAILLGVASISWAALPDQVEMRGLGKIKISSQFFGDGDKKSSWITFAAEDAKHAEICASKFVADYTQWGPIKEVADSKLPGTVLELKGTGLWLVGIDGSKVQILFAKSEAELQALSQKASASSWKKASARAYPRWLDCFDNSGIGIWFGGGGAPVDIESEFPWMKEHKFAFCNQPPKESRYVAPGILDTTFTDWFGAMCAKYDLPYRSLLWELAERPQWAWNISPLPYVQAMPGYLAQPDIRNTRLSAHSAYEPVPKIDLYAHDFRRRFAEGLNNDPNLMGHHGLEEVPAAGIGELAAVAGMPETKAAWHEYLKDVLGFDLKQVSLAHKGNANAYKSWDEVNVPTARDFMGFNENSIELSGTWEGLPDKKSEGATAKWYAEGTPKEGWVSVQSNDPALLIYGGGNNPNAKKENHPVPRSDYWLRRKFTVKDAKQLASLKYLQVQRSIWHGPYTTYCDAYINGKQLIGEEKKDYHGDLTISLDVNNSLKVGENEIYICTHGSPPAGFITLGPLPLRDYPGFSEAENRLWFDGVNFDAWYRMKNMENILKAMRSADPNRPFKIMATINLMDMATQLSEKYGAYQHDTGGAGGYWAPMTGARVSRSRGLPWSCEQGGPPDDDPLRMQSAITFYLMYGNDAADLVFSVSAYKDKPKVAEWVEKNLAKMHCIGKMDLPDQKIAILRSSRATRLGFSDPWNWDVGRGTLQAIGRNFVYVEVPDIKSGLISNYPIIIDDGTVLMTTEDVEGIKKYVEKGGIFVAQHHTGRHLPEKSDAWPLATAFGLKVEPKLINADNYHQWPMGKIKFTDTQTLVPSLKGKEFEGSGVAIDYLNQLHTGAIALEGEGRGITPVAHWKDGKMAIVEVKRGKGKLVYLGSPFYLRLKDVAGQWINGDDLQVLLDEMLTGLGSPRDSWTGNREIWAELWESKTGVFDLYPVARMNKKGDGKITSTPIIRRETPVKEVIEVSANGHPVRQVNWEKGKLTLPKEDFDLMEFHMYAAPRPDVEKAALHWIEVQSQIWRAIAEIPASERPKVVNPVDTVETIVDGWKMTTGQTDEAWAQPGFSDSSWKSVKLGTFLTMGLNDTDTAQFRREVAIPSKWKGRQVVLVFNSDWSFGFSERGRLWINGKPAALKKPLSNIGDNDFSIDVTDLGKDGKILLALEVDGKLLKDKKRGRPAGVTGIFYLQSEVSSASATPLSSPWQAASDVNVFTPAEAGKQTSFVYMENRFALPKSWPSKRVFLESKDSLGWIILNGYVLYTPSWMKSLDISGMVNKDGENILRWIPTTNGRPNFSTPNKDVPPTMQLAWKP